MVQTFYRVIKEIKNKGDNTYFGSFLFSNFNKHFHAWPSLDFFNITNNESVLGLNHVFKFFLLIYFNFGFEWINIGMKSFSTYFIIRSINIHTINQKRTKNYISWLIISTNQSFSNEILIF